jgi:hypothetical protein
LHAGVSVFYVRSSDRPLSPALLQQHVPKGLDVCDVPAAFAHKAWMKAGKKGRGLHRGALMPAILRLRFPNKPWCGLSKILFF